MIALAVTSSTAQASVGLYSETQTLVEKVSDNPKRHSEFLNVALQSCLHEARLNWSQIDVLAVDHGPGSFTGIRVACNVIRALSYAIEKPIFQTDSLTFLHSENPSQQPTLSMINAYRNMVYFSTRVENAIGHAKAASAADLKALLPKQLWNCRGDGYAAFVGSWTPEFIFDPLQIVYPRSSVLARLALSQRNTWTKDWKLIIPLYIRASAAEENKEGMSLYHGS